MKIYRSGKMAEETLREIRKISRSIKHLRSHVTSYENGREAGLVLHVEGEYETPFYGFETAYTFSENRNSDDVVVYHGNFDRALRLGDTYKDEAKAGDKMYEERGYFRNPAAAALAIVQDAKQKASLFRKGKGAKKRQVAAKR